MSTGLTSRIAQYNELVGRLDDLIALESIRELGVFRALLQGPLTASTLAQNTSTSPTRLTPFLDLVVHLGFLRRTCQGYALVEGDEALFGEQGPYGDVVPEGHLSYFLGRRGSAVEVLLSDEALPSPATGTDLDQDKRDAFFEQVHAYSRRVADEVADLLGGGGLCRIADLGCGPGTYSMALLARSPQASAVLVDRPMASGFVDGLIQRSGHEARAKFVAGCMLSDDFGDDFDLILGSEIIHNFGVDDNRALLQRMANRLRSGGRVAIKDAHVEPDRAGPLGALRFGLALALFSAKGGVYADTEVIEWCREVGLEYEVTHRLQTHPGAYVVVARKP